MNRGGASLSLEIYVLCLSIILGIVHIVLASHSASLPARLSLDGKCKHKPHEESDG
jgi:hypothetical protein